MTETWSLRDLARRVTADAAVRADLDELVRLLGPQDDDAWSVYGVARTALGLVWPFVVVDLAVSRTVVVFEGRAVDASTAYLVSLGMQVPDGVGPLPVCEGVQVRLPTRSPGGVFATGRDGQEFPVIVPAPPSLPGWPTWVSANGWVCGVYVASGTGLRERDLRGAQLVDALAVAARAGRVAACGARVVHA